MFRGIITRKLQGGGHLIWPKISYRAYRMSVYFYAEINHNPKSMYVNLVVGGTCVPHNFWPVLSTGLTEFRKGLVLRHNNNVSQRQIFFISTKRYSKMYHSSICCYVGELLKEIPSDQFCI